MVDRRRDFVAADPDFTIIDKPAQKLFAGASWHPFLPTFCFSWSCNCILTAGHTRVLYSTKLRRKGSCNAGSVVIAWIRLRSRVDGALQDFLTFCSIGRVRSRVRPVDTADVAPGPNALRGTGPNRKSTRLNSSHVRISYAVFCLKKKKKNKAS